MLVLLLFGKRDGNLDYAFGDPKFLSKETKSNEMQTFKPLMVFNIAVTLYGIGEELDGGKLRDLDMKHYLVVTHMVGNTVVLIGIKDFAKNKKNVDLLKTYIEQIHSICQYVQDQIASQKLITTEQIKEKLSELFKGIPVLKKEFKKLEQILIS
ncbi:MAG: hypothetical protein ACTSWW_09735 [Promethearchaeota archaeon]